MASSRTACFQQSLFHVGSVVLFFYRYSLYLWILLCLVSRFELQKGTVIFSQGCSQAPCANPVSVNHAVRQHEELREAALPIPSPSTGGFVQFAFRSLRTERTRRTLLSSSVTISCGIFAHVWFRVVGSIFVRLAARSLTPAWCLRAATLVRELKFREFACDALLGVASTGP